MEGMKTSKISTMGFLHILISQTVAKNLPWIIHFDEKIDHLKGDSQIDFAMGKVFPFLTFLSDTHPLTQKHSSPKSIIRCPQMTMIQRQSLKTRTRVSILRRPI